MRNGEVIPNKLELTMAELSVLKRAIDSHTIIVPSEIFPLGVITTSDWLDAPDVKAVLNPTAIAALKNGARLIEVIARKNA